MDPILQKAEDKLQRLMADPDIRRRYYEREKEIREETLRSYSDALKHILKSEISDQLKVEHLTKMIRQMEMQFDIPSQYCEKYEEANPDVMQLYRQILGVRKMD